MLSRPQASPSRRSSPRGPTSSQDMPGRDGMESRPAAIVLDPIGGISGDMFIAGVLDAWPELAEPVLAAMRASLPAGCDVSIEARVAGELPRAGLLLSGKIAS